jgi:hypothetical protein
MVISFEPVRCRQIARSPDQRAMAQVNAIEAADGGCDAAGRHAPRRIARKGTQQPHQPQIQAKYVEGGDIAAAD